MAITPLTTPTAQRTDPEAVFIVRADILAAELPVMVDEINVEIVNINTRSDQVAADTVTVTDAKDIALASANFVGAWSSLTGALNVPASVSHLGIVWILTENLADVTAATPGTAAQWLSLPNIATVAELRSGEPNKLVEASSVYSANAPVVSSGGGSFAFDFEAGRVFQRTLTANSTLANPTNQVAGQSGLLYILQDATGGRTLSYGTHWDAVGATPSIETGAGAVNVFSYHVREVGAVTLIYVGSVA